MMRDQIIKTFFVLWLFFWMAMIFVAYFFHFSLSNTIPPGEMPGYSMNRTGSWSWSGIKNTLL